jgi:hypothetical protein
MAIGTASAIAGAGALASAFGGSKKQKVQEQKTGFQAYPKEVQDYLLNTYLPRVQAEATQPYQAIPMRRAANPQNDPFASKGLYELQQFSDAQGGYFTPYTQGGEINQASYGQPQQQQPAAQGGGSSSLAQMYINSLINSGNNQNKALGQMMLDNVGAGTYGFDKIGNVLNQIGYGTKTFDLRSTPSDLLARGEFEQAANYDMFGMPRKG